MTRSLRTIRSLVIAGLPALALIVATATAPAQPVPHQPGSAVPSATPGAPTPAPIPSLFPSASPSAGAQGTSPLPATSGPVPLGSATPSGLGATPSVVRFTGELLDVRSDYIYFTTADAFKAAPELHIVDLDTGGPTRLVPGPGVFARATLDVASGSITTLALTKRPLPTDAAYQQAYEAAHAYAVRGTPLTVAPELNRGPRLTGRPVAVTFVVQVPPTTPLTDSVYLTTDASGWVANAMKMDRIDALHYRLTRNYASGTQFAYRFTRGSWQSVEVGEDGLEADAHEFQVPEVNAISRKNTVYRWSDQNPSEPNVGPDTIPTPFNPNPFGGFPSGNAHPGIPPASPTPRP